VELNVSSRSHDDHTIVTISGEIDLYTAPRLHGELAALIADGKPARVVVDMSGVEFCDSTGMNVLLSCLRRARERGGELEIAAPKPAVRKILQVTGLDSVFTLVDEADLNRTKPAVPQHLYDLPHARRGRDRGRHTRAERGRSYSGHRHRGTRPAQGRACRGCGRRIDGCHRGPGRGGWCRRDATHPESRQGRGDGNRRGGDPAAGPGHAAAPAVPGCRP